MKNDQNSAKSYRPASKYGLERLETEREIVLQIPPAKRAALRNAVSAKATRMGWTLTCRARADGAMAVAHAVDQPVSADARLRERFDFCRTKLREAVALLRALTSPDASNADEDAARQWLAEADRIKKAAAARARDAGDSPVTAG